MSDKNIVAPPSFQRPAPNRRGLVWGVVGALVVAVGAVVLVCVLESRPNDLVKLQARYDALVADDRKDEAAKVLLDVRADAIRLYEARRFDEAKAVCEWIVSKDPKNAVAINVLGLLESSRAETEARMANEKLGIKSTDPPKVLPRYEKAVDLFKRAAEADPLSPESYNNLAGIYFRQKNYVECEKQLELAMRTGLRAHYHLLYARCAEELKRSPEIIKRRLHDTVTCADAQANALAEGKIAINRSIGDVWKDAARKLAEAGDDFGWENLRKAASSAPHPEVREFAKSLLKSAGKP